jgi:hypothetical protein
LKKQNYWIYLFYFHGGNLYIHNFNFIHDFVSGAVFSVSLAIVSLRFATVWKREAFSGSKFKPLSFWREPGIIAAVSFIFVEQLFKGIETIYFWLLFMLLLLVELPCFKNGN